MRFTKFRIKNFKGISSAEIDLAHFGQGKVFTLVGLNECGKTTILEAINSFSPDLTAEPIFQNDVFRKIEYKDLVPKHRKDNFTGNVEVEAFLELSDDDKQDIAQFLKQNQQLEVDLERLGNNFSVQKIFKFEQSDYQDQESLWSISLYAKKGRAKKFKELQGDAWQEAVSYIGKLIPSICYFPTFLFEFPTRVYLSHAPEQNEPQNKYYWQIIQDVLDSLERELTIEEHIVNRVRKTEEGQEWSLSRFFQSDQKEQVDAVMNLVGNEITKSIFTRWNEIFGSEFKKDIKIDWHVDGDHQDSHIYLSFRIQDGASTYSIAERSMGFRWFFCFLLFTQFRKSRRESGTLFLLDEPASNLHATAQKQLLASFESVTEGNNILIYSTHSHYMINPRWLEGAYIVQNRAIECDNELSSSHEYQQRDTDIKVLAYRRFVGENPDKSTYYQPILDALDYSPSSIEHQSETVMVEGKSDFYVFTYFKNVILNEQRKLQFLPSSGANDLGPLIALYLGWGLTFKILLDDDKAGKEAKKRYMDEWYLDDSTVSTIGEIDETLTNKRLEGLISKEGKQIIKDHLELSKLTKKQIAHFFQEKLARNEEVSFDESTISNFQLVIANVCKYFDSIQSL